MKEYSACLKKLDQLQRQIFVVYLERNYIENQYEYEKAIHKIRLEYFQLSCQHLNNKAFQAQINILFEIISALASLRYRIKDHSIFEVCENELKAVSENLSELFKTLARHTTSLLKIKLSELLVSIKSLEEMMQTLLQIVSKEPLVLFIFLQDLRLLYDNLEILVNEELHPSER
jgi:hypothetical protein